MSIVAYFARLSSDQLAAYAQNPQLLASPSVGQLPGAEIIDIDRSWEPMAWLVSPLKRVEQQHNSMVMSEAMARRRQPKQTLASRIANVFKSKAAHATSDPVSASLKRIDAIPLDPLLIAIEGRTEIRDERFNFGMGSAAIFPPEEVSRLNGALAAVGADRLANELQPALMDSMGVFPAHWVEEGDDLMENYIRPNFMKLQAFYSSASQEKQTVIMWYV